MSDAFWTSLAAVLISMFNAWRLWCDAKKINKTAEQVQQVHHEVNGHMSAYLEQTREAAKAKGQLEGLEQAGAIPPHVEKKE